jgi:hypothetical protein
MYWTVRLVHQSEYLCILKTLQSTSSGMVTTEHCIQIVINHVAQGSVEWISLLCSEDAGCKLHMIDGVVR